MFGWLFLCLCLTNMLSRDLSASSASLFPIAFVLTIPNMFTENFEKNQSYCGCDFFFPIRKLIRITIRVEMGVKARAMPANLISILGTHITEG